MGKISKLPPPHSDALWLAFVATDSVDIDVYNNGSPASLVSTVPPPHLFTPILLLDSSQPPRSSKSQQLLLPSL